MSDLEQPWEEGRQIARRYTLERRLGGGSAGEVWLAEDRLLKKAVALKVLHPDLAKSRDTVRRFLREVALAHSVTHPQVVRIYDTGEEDGLPFFTMEYLQGQTLEELLEGEGERHVEPLAFEQVRSIALDVLDAMAAAHRVGVVHRDLKPGNVMLTHRGAIVMDFGVAGVEELAEAPNAANAHSLVRTEAGTIFGSPAYMAPELWEGEHATVQSDLYAFGVMLYQMLTGRLPYRAKTPAGYLQQLSAGPPVPLRSIRRDAPWSMVRLVARCMARDPDDRPANATAATNLVSPLRGTNRRRLVLAAAAVLGIGLAGGVFRTPPSHKAMGLPDALAADDLAAAVRSYDAGDPAAAQRRLDRLSALASDSAGLRFWRATVAHELRDEAARRDACGPVSAESTPPRGHAAWQALATAACAERYGFPEVLVEELTGDPDSVPDDLLPLLVEWDLLPRLEASREGDAVRELAPRVLRRLREETPEPGPRALPTRWAVTGFDLELAIDRVAEATERIDDLLEGPPEAVPPVVTRRAAWLAQASGDLERALELASRIRHIDPRPWFDLQLRQGRLEPMRVRLAEVDPAYVAAVREMWCGYAWRFEVSPRPAECVDLPASLAGALWAPADAPAAALPTVLEDAIAQAQRDRTLGTCGIVEAGRTPLTHAPAPFATRRAELAVEAALCDNDPTRAAPAEAQTLVGQLRARVPGAPWVQLLHATVEDARRQTDNAQSLRLQVEEVWQGADDDLPAVRALRTSLHGPASRSAAR